MMAMPAPQPSLEAVTIPAPIGGLNTIAAGTAMPEGDCPQLFNLVSGEHGLRSRLGSREWCTGLTGALNPEVRTVMPFTGSSANGTKNRLYACTSTGIWAVSSSSAAPSQVLTFGTQTGDAGWGICHAMVTSAGHFLLYCDEENGYHVYTESTDTWAKVAMGGGAGQVSGVDPSTLCFAVVWKSRVFFVEKNTTKAWYLSAGAVYGAATALDLDRSAQFRAGGPLVGLWNWTLDGGIGIDDHLVGVSQGGDVAVYSGTDPASANTFALRGTWGVGALPAGRRIATSFGGDVLLLTKAGIRPLSQLVSGGDGSGVYQTAKIANLFNNLTLLRSDLLGWALYLHPEDNSLIVAVPTESGAATEQLVQSLWNRSWSRYRDLPLYSAAVWNKKLYFGTVDGRVLVNDGYVDGVTLADPTAYTAVQWALLTPFRNYENGRQKQVQMIRPTILSESGRPAYQAQARYSYDLRELSDVSTPSPSGDTWDSALWDVASWAGDYVSTQMPTGGAGMGVDFAVAMRGTATARTVVVQADVLFQQGGFL